MESLKRKKGSAYIPARLIVGSFALAITIGTLLLMLPISSKSGEITPFIDALFTATSATCVTGLVVVDTFTHWTIFGQIVLLGLIQIGGLGLITFTTFFNVALGKKLGLRGMQLAQETISTSSFIDIAKLVKSVIAIVLSIEVVGACLLAVSFVPKYGSEGIFISIFIAISSFCNAGFDLLGREGPFASLTNYNGDSTVMWTVMVLIILGGLGFIVLNDLLQYRKTKKLLLHTRIVLTVTAVLLLLGTLNFLIFEWNNPATMANFTMEERINASAFQSVTVRTAGYNSIDVHGMHEITKIFSIILMFIGAAPGSTAGGIKVTTFAVLLMTVICVIKGNEDTIIHKRKVTKNVVYKATAIASMALVGVFLATCMTAFALYAAGIPFSGLDAAFEVTSAFSTVGISSGITGIANIPAKIVLIITMFIGRVGPVSLALSLAMRPTTSKKEIIPEAKIMVG